MALLSSPWVTVMYFVVHRAAPTGAFQLRGAMFGKGACLMRRDSWTYDDLVGKSRSGNKN
jgi:hypothetical protein